MSGWPSKQRARAHHRRITPLSNTPLLVVLVATGGRSKHFPFAACREDCSAIKSPSDTISHVCMGEVKSHSVFTDRYNAEGSIMEHSDWTVQYGPGWKESNWEAGEALCQYAHFEDGQDVAHVMFHVKDAAGACGNAHFPEFEASPVKIAASCNQTVRRSGCQGGAIDECKWTFAVPSCGTPL